MERSQGLIYGQRTNGYSRYDKRLIVKIVKEVEAGLPRKEAIKMYGLGTSTLDSWLKMYGSENYQEHLKRKQYSALQKRTIVAAIEQCRMSIQEARVAYKIKNEKTIRAWLQQYKTGKLELCVDKQLPMGKPKKIDTTTQAEALQKALQEAELKIKALNTLIDIAEEQLKIDIRKKSGAKQS